ncbi:MAG: winged helix DNA-binding protein [Alphaproteobacteria bacterium]|nr:winged helix DNA-binding protein [Alphaproteobacteria bacterium]
MNVALKARVPHAPELPAAPESSAELKPLYLETLNRIERLHRQLLDVIKDELERVRIRDVNSVQALLLFNIGDAEMTAGELRTRGHYLGSNVSYNLKKLVDMGYINHARSEVDRRSVRVRLTEKGRVVHKLCSGLFDRHTLSVDKVGGVDPATFVTLNDSLRRLERFWADQIRFRL